MYNEELIPCLESFLPSKIHRIHLLFLQSIHVTSTYSQGPEV